MTGRVREARGHRHVGGALWRDGHTRRHTGTEIALLAIAAVGTAVSTYAAYESSTQQADAAKRAAKYNQQAAQQQAAASTSAATLDVETSRERFRRLMATQRARMGASGVEVGVGSPLLVELDQAREAQRDEQLIRYGGGLRAAGFQSEASLQGFYGRVASSQRDLAGLNAGANLLAGGARLGSTYYRPSSAPGAQEPVRLA